MASNERTAFKHTGARSGSRSPRHGVDCQLICCSREPAACAWPRYYRKYTSVTRRDILESKMLLVAVLVLTPAPWVAGGYARLRRFGAA
jgi:hypothetical protein